MALIHIGTALTLVQIPIANCSNGDSARIWLNSYDITMVFDSSATNESDVSEHLNTKYYVRPDDYLAGPGVWVEDVGVNQRDRATGGQIIGGEIQSINYSLATGSSYDLDNAFLKLGGSNVDATGSAKGVFLGSDADEYKLYVGDGSDQYFKYDGTNISWQGTNASLSTTGVMSVSNILATGGVVGGFTIDPAEGLYAGTDVSRVQMKPSIGIWSGATAFVDAPFHVSNAGNLYASNATISGEITATSGTIGGWSANTTSLYSTNIGLHSASFASGAEILIGHASSFASAKIGLKSDGSGKLANNKIYWDVFGNITLDVPANAGTGLGIIYKGGNRWLYDFNPATNASGVTPDGFNLFFGVNSGNLSIGSTATSITQASYNVGIGLGTLYSLTTGAYNIAIGYHALFDVTTASNNTAIGTGAAENLISGGYNLAIGHYALSTSTNGSYNTAIGSNALSSIESNGACVAVGTSALQNCTGSANCAIGYNSMLFTTSGTSNSAFGEDALSRNTTGSQNLALGRYAGKFLSGGSTSNQTPSQSIYIGNFTEAKVAAGVNEIVIGYEAVGNGSNTITLGNSSITNIITYGNFRTDRGIITMKETTTPSALTNYGKIYTKTDNKLYFQDGAGTEHEIAFI